MSFVHFDNMTWPSCNDKELAWRLLHIPGAITEADMRMAASYIGAFKALLERTQKERNSLCKKIKELSK